MDLDLVSMDFGLGSDFNGSGLVLVYGFKNEQFSWNWVVYFKVSDIMVDKCQQMVDNRPVFNYSLFPDNSVFVNQLFFFG